MSGTKAGGLKAAETNRQKYGTNFYRRIGTKGGHNGHTGGFAANPKLARIAGQKGGQLSVRGASLENLVEGRMNPMTEKLYKAWLPQVIKIYNKACNTSITYQAPTHPNDYYEQLKLFLYDDPELVDEKVTLAMAVLSKFYDTTGGRMSTLTPGLVEIKTMVLSMSERAAISWTQAKGFVKEWGESLLKNVNTTV